MSKKPKGYAMETGKDNSETAPDTTAFKNVKPEDIPDSTYTYKGQDVWKGSSLPKNSYSYKGANVGKGDALPKSNYNYKGDSSAGKGKAHK